MVILGGNWFKVGNTVQTPFGNGGLHCVALTPTRVAVLYPTDTLPNKLLAAFEFNEAYPLDWTMVGNPSTNLNVVTQITALNAYDVMVTNTDYALPVRFDGTDWTITVAQGTPAVPAGFVSISVTGVTALNGADIAVAYDSFPAGPFTPPAQSGFAVLRWDGAAWSQVSGHFDIDLPSYDVKNLMAVTGTRLVAMCGFYNGSGGGVLTYELTPSSLPTLPVFDPV